MKAVLLLYFQDLDYILLFIPIEWPEFLWMLKFIYLCLVSLRLMQEIINFYHHFVREGTYEKCVRYVLEFFNIFTKLRACVKKSMEPFEHSEGWCIRIESPWISRRKLSTQGSSRFYTFSMYSSYATSHWAIRKGSKDHTFPKYGIEFERTSR